MGGVAVFGQGDTVQEQPGAARQSVGAPPFFIFYLSFLFFSFRPRTLTVIIFVSNELCMRKKIRYFRKISCTVRCSAGYADCTPVSQRHFYWGAVLH